MSAVEQAATGVQLARAEVRRVETLHYQFGRATKREVDEARAVYRAALTELRDAEEVEQR
ncbi:hypothetical protein [Isoptericola sp. NPDC056605]|uniref:hypothetical protein n=1 Tax=Isoptericola sp. NPDC056605 TaxID=3345876 RepID=UPI003687625D